MNVAMPILGIILVIGAVVGLTGLAAQNAEHYTDTYGNAPTEAVNASQDAITVDYAAPVLNFGGAVVLFLAAIAVLIAAVGAWRAMGGGYTGRRG